MKTVCVVTGTRAEYGLLRWIMEGIRQSEILDLQLLVTGMHLSPEFGLTVTAIEEDGYKVDRRVEMLLSSDTPVGITKSLGLGLIGFADALSEMKPSMVLLLGDRYEMLGAAIASMIARIPIAHLHGGESTEGLIDEPIRHSITKMAQLHFVATSQYRKRVIQLGENPKRVFDVGGVGIDNVMCLELLSRSELEDSLGVKLLERNLLITFHPVTLEVNTGAKQFAELLAALEELKQTFVVFTMPNADTDGRVLFNQILDFCNKHSNTRAFKSLGQVRYLSCVKHFDGVLGNSSSGLIEVPAFKKGTINIGDRQRGRVRASSVIDCEPERLAILAAIERLYSNSFQSALGDTQSPYGTGGASKKVVDLLEKIELTETLKKRFYDMPSL